MQIRIHSCQVVHFSRQLRKVENIHPERKMCLRFARVLCGSKQCCSAHYIYIYIFFKTPKYDIFQMRIENLFFHCIQRNHDSKNRHRCLFCRRLMLFSQSMEGISCSTKERNKKPHAFRCNYSHMVGFLIWFCMIIFTKQQLQKPVINCSLLHTQSLSAPGEEKATCIRESSVILICCVCFCLECNSNTLSLTSASPQDAAVEWKEV